MYHFHQCWDERKQELGQKREKDAVFGFWRLNVKGLWDVPVSSRYKLT